MPSMAAGAPVAWFTCGNIHQPELELVDNALYHFLPDWAFLLAIGALATAGVRRRGVGDPENVGQER